MLHQSDINIRVYGTFSSITIFHPFQNVQLIKLIFTRAMMIPIPGIHKKLFGQ